MHSLPPVLLPHVTGVTAQFLLRRLISAFKMTSYIISCHDNALFSTKPEFGGLAPPHLEHLSPTSDLVTRTSLEAFGGAQVAVIGGD
ncbi:hypothetical protein CEXT_77031 [Caerostris extrusa]|uniref:Uncharacterized protein n=1 Tax=Caerostris extrusa TaxID=172846 RepID=A0AAV4QT77_CAEEX|nr:hypothetical protein CEXT_77031 [Caerostris extrusa]